MSQRFINTLQNHLFNFLITFSTVQCGFCPVPSFTSFLHEMQTIPMYQTFAWLTKASVLEDHYLQSSVPGKAKVCFAYVQCMLYTVII